MKIINLSNFNARVKRWKDVTITRRQFIAFSTAVNISKGMCEMRSLRRMEEVGIRRNNRK